MENRDLKSNLLRDSRYYDYARYRFAENKVLYNAGNDTYYDKYLEAKDKLCDFTPEEIKACRQLFDCNRQRASRLKKKIVNWSKRGFVYFVTFTFNDDAFFRSSSLTRRDAVCRYLSDRDVVYAANLDFGGEFEREHYHAIICSEKEIPGKYVFHKSKKGKVNCYLESDFLQRWIDIYGYATLQGPIFRDDCFDNKNASKVSKYVSKCANHALKETAKSPRLLYSRKKYDWFYKKT